MKNFSETSPTSETSNLETIRQFANNEEIDLLNEAIWYGGKEYPALFLAQGENNIPDSVKTTIMQYTLEHVLNGDFRSGNCASIAGDAVNNLRKILETNGYAISTIGTNSHDRPIAFYKNKGYKHHIINLLEGEDISVAVDFTSYYSMSEPGKPIYIFSIIAKSTSEVERLLKKLTGINWENRN